MIKIKHYLGDSGSHKAAADDNKFFDRRRGPGRGGEAAGEGGGDGEGAGEERHSGGLRTFERLSRHCRQSRIKNTIFYHLAVGLHPPRPLLQAGKGNGDRIGRH